MENASIDTAHLPNTLADGDLAYGCIFCRTGKEAVIADKLMGKFSSLRALVPQKVLYVRENKRLIEKVSILFPGYIFVEAPISFSIREISREDGVFKVLTSSDEEWYLSGSDEEYARKLFEIGGTVGISKVYYEGDRIRAVSGLLCDYEGQIVRVDRRKSKAQVRFHVGLREVLVWLGFEEIDRPSGR